MSDSVEFLEIGDLVQFNKWHIPVEVEQHYGDFDIETEFEISERVRNRFGKFHYLVKLPNEDRTKVVYYISFTSLTKSRTQEIKENRKNKLEDLLDD